MKIFKLVISVALVILMGAAACARKKNYPNPPAYEGNVNNEFPIVASYAFYPPFITEQQFQWAREAGFNILRKSLDYSQIDECLKLASENHIYIMVCPWDIKDVGKIPEIVRRYKGNPNVWGYGVADEPVPSQFENLSEIVDKLEQLDPGKNSYINLLPEDSPGRLQARSYQAYVEDYVETVNPPFLSVDSYPIRRDKNGKIYIEDGYFNSLWEIAKTAKASSRPFWSYVLSVKHWMYPAPKEEFIRFQVFSALAFGAQGINYFTYLMPDYDKGKGEYSDAPIDWNGNRTPTWFMVKNVNREIRNLEKVFLGAEVIDINFTGNKIPSVGKKLRKPTKPLKKIDSDGAGLIVSRLRNDCKEYMLIVNRDVENMQKVTLEFTKPVVNLFGNGSQRIYTDSIFNLEAGGYALFLLN